MAFIMTMPKIIQPSTISSLVPSTIPITIDMVEATSRIIIIRSLNCSPIFSKIDLFLCGIRCLSTQRAWRDLASFSDKPFLFELVSDSA